MANFVLIHGAWHWGGCYQKLAAELLAAGHNVAMPDLASHGFDATPPGSVADMAQYTAQAGRMIEASSEKVIVVGHSMGGASCSFLGERYAEKIAALVYLAAFLIPNGLAPMEYLAKQAGSAVLPNPLVAPVADGLKLDISREAEVKDMFYNDCSAHDVAVAIKNLQPVQPFAPGMTPSAVTEPRFGRLRRAYIECTEDHALSIAMQRQMQAGFPGTELFTLNTGHSPFFSAPRALAGILYGLT